jgi:hypothetical protein
MRRHALDLTKYTHKQVHGEMTLYMTWFSEDGTVEDAEPCICIIPTRGKLGHFRPAVIALSAAYKYDIPEVLANNSREFAKTLGLGDRPNTVFKIATLIHDHLLDLIKMPPKPVENVVVGADAVITNKETGKSIEIEVKDNV